MKSNKLYLLSLIILFSFAFISCSQKFKKYSGKPAHFISADTLTKIRAGRYEEAEEYFNYLVSKKPYSIDGVRMLEVFYGQISSAKNIEEPLNEWN
jgi:outer membrane protein assembly factor BamD (BamD/ComL family)